MVKKNVRRDKEESEFRLARKFRFRNVSISELVSNKDNTRIYKINKFYKDENGEYKESNTFYFEDLQKLYEVVKAVIEEDIVMESYDNNN